MMRQVLQETQELGTTSIEAKVGAPVSHVEVHAAGATPVPQDLGEGVGHLLGAGVGHVLAPVSQPPRTAKRRRCEGAWWMGFLHAWAY